MKVLVVGGNFAGSTAALEIKRKLGKEELYSSKAILTPLYSDIGRN